MIIKISDPLGTQHLFIRKLFAFSAVKKLNESGILKVSFADMVNGLDNFEIKKGYLIQAFLPGDNKQVHCVFSGYIEERSIAGTVVTLVAYDFIGYAKHRMIRTDLHYNNTPIKDIITNVITTLTGVSSLPFELGINECTTPITIEFQAFTSLYSIFKELSKKVQNLEIRHRSEATTRGALEFVDVSTHTGVTHEGLRTDNALVQQRKSKVIAREWRDNFGNFCNYWRDDHGNVRQDAESIANGLLFEKYEQNPEKAPEQLDSNDGLPKIVPEVSVKDMASLQVGDRKQIRLISKLKRAKFEFLGIIQETNLTSNSSGGRDYSVKVGEKLVDQKNLLDKTLSNLTQRLAKLEK